MYFERYHLPPPDQLNIARSSLHFVKYTSRNCSDGKEYRIIIALHK